MATRFRLNFEQIFGTSAQVLAGGTLTFCISHGAPDQLQAIYSDDALTVPKLNPVTLDSAGKHGDIFLQPKDYRVILKDAAGIVQPGGDVDPVHGGPSAAFINALDYGVDVTGATSSVAALTAAVAAAQCATLVLPVGTLLIDSLWDISGVARVVGQGRCTILKSAVTSLDNSFIKASNTSDLGLSDFQVQSNDTRLTLTLCNRLRVRNILFTGTWANAAVLTAHGLVLEGCDNVQIEDCTFLDYNDAIYLDKSGSLDCGRVRVSQCWFQHAAHGNSFQFPAQVYQFHCSHLTVDNCDFKDIFPGLAGGASIAYSVYEGDGSAVTSQMLNCRVIVTEADVRHVAFRTTLAQEAMMMGNIVRSEIAGGGGMMCTLNAINEIMVRDNIVHGFDALLVENGTCQAVDFSGNFMQDCGRSSLAAAVRFGVSGNSTAIVLATARGNKIRGAQYGGIFLNTATWFDTDGNEVIDCNKSNTIYSGGVNDYRVSGICAFGASNGAIRGNYVANVFGGHTKYGVAVGATHTIDVWIPGTFPGTPHTTNRFAGIETANMLNPNGDGTVMTA